MWPHRFQLWWVAATFLPQEVYPYSFSLLYFFISSLSWQGFWTWPAAYGSASISVWKYTNMSHVSLQADMRLSRTKQGLCSAAFIRKVKFPALFLDISDPSDCFLQIDIQDFYPLFWTVHKLFVSVQEVMHFLSLATATMVAVVQEASVAQKIDWVIQ